MYPQAAEGGEGEGMREDNPLLTSQGLIAGRCDNDTDMVSRTDQPPGRPDTVLIPSDTGSGPARRAEIGQSRAARPPVASDTVTVCLSVCVPPRQPPTSPSGRRDLPVSPLHS